MYPHVNGIGGTNGSHRSNNTQGRTEQDVKDINIFEESDVEESYEDRTLSWMQRTKQNAEEASKDTKAYMEKVKNYVKQGYSYSEAFKAADEETDGVVNRENLVERLVKQGYDRETAERLIPKDIDARIAEARADGIRQGLKDNEAIYKKVYGPHFKTYFK